MTQANYLIAYGCISLVVGAILAMAVYAQYGTSRSDAGAAMLLGMFLGLLWVAIVPMMIVVAVGRYLLYPLMTYIEYRADHRSNSIASVAPPAEQEQALPEQDRFIV